MNTTPCSSPQPEIRLPGGSVTVSHAAETLFRQIRHRQVLFNRGDELVEVTIRDDEYEFNPINAAAAVSRFEDYARFGRLQRREEGEPQFAPATLTEKMAKLLLETRQRRTELDTIRGVLQFPLQVERDGQLVTLQQGFDCESGLFIASSEPVVEMSAADGAGLLKDLLADYQFQSDGDLSRALASFLTPALKFGGFIDGPIPIEVAEADDSQAGKSYRQTLVPALYNHKMTVLAVPHRGVGSLDESIDQAMIRGKPFIQIDNLRGKLDSQKLEALVTANGEFNARAAYTPNASVDASKVMFFVSSNGFEATRDLANRSFIIRQRKRPGHIWRTFDGRNLRQHIEAHLPQCQGAVMAVIREWHAQGKRRTGITEHSFQDWAQPLDWMVTQQMHEAPLLQGHAEAKVRVTNPHLSFLRQLFLRMEANNRLGTPITASRIVELCEQETITIPGLRPDANEDTGRQHIGRIMAGVFKNSNELVIEEFRVVRVQEYAMTDAGNCKQVNSYQMTRLNAPATPALAPATPGLAPAAPALAPAAPGLAPQPLAA